MKGFLKAASCYMNGFLKAAANSLKDRWTILHTSALLEPISVATSGFKKLFLATLAVFGKIIRN